MVDPAGSYTLDWTIDRVSDSPFVTLTCIDTYTQARYEYRIPWHALPSMRDRLDELINAHAGEFPAIVRRVSE